MIRKILLFVFLIFTIIWFAIAYTIKNNVVNLIKNSESDNIKIAYNDMTISGYPFCWKISLLNPNVKLIDHETSREFTNEKATLTISCSAKKSTINLNKLVKGIEHYQDKSSEYAINSDEMIQAITKFNKPLYKISKDDDLVSIVKSIKFDNKKLLVSKDNKGILNIQNLAFYIDKQNFIEHENIFISLNVNYNSEPKTDLNLLKCQSANLDLASYLKFTTNKGNLNILNNLTVDHFSFLCDGNSKINIKGGLQFFTDKLPQGKLSFELQNHSIILDKLLPGFSKKIVKAIIDKASNKVPEQALLINDTGTVTQNPTYHDSEQAKFDIDFSDQGISIDSINILDLKIGEDKEAIKP